MFDDLFDTSSGPGDKFDANELLGKTLVIIPSEYIESMKTEYSDDKDAVVADVIVVDSGDVLEDTMIFQGRLIAATKRLVGRDKVKLGTLVQKPSKVKGKPAWDLDTDVSDAKKAKAAELLKAHRARQNESLFSDADA